ncbi:MAG: DNA-directed DNA polymerase [Methanosarcinales archaeon]
MTQLFQILDADYIYDNQNNPVVRLFGRDELGNSVCCLVPNFKPYFYIKISGNLAEISQEIKNKFSEYVSDIEIVERYEPIGYQTSKKKMLKLIIKDPKTVPVIRDEIKKMNRVQEIYETDILFRNRFLIDNEIGGMQWVQASDLDPLLRNGFKSCDFSEAPYTYPYTFITNKLEKCNILKNSLLKYLAFDIECLLTEGGMPSPDKSPIIMISLAFEPSLKEYKTMVLVSKEVDSEYIEEDVITFSSEEEMLRFFFDLIKRYDPDVIIGYNSNEFDFPYIVERAKILNIDPNIGRDDKRGLYVKKIANKTQVSVTGRIVVDMLPLIRRGFSLKQYDLRTVSKQLLNLEKFDIAPKEMEEYWNSDGEKFKKFIDYARRDSELALKLLLDLKILDKYIALSKVSGALLQDILDGGQTGMVENLLLREFKKHNRLIPPKPASKESEDRYEHRDELKGGAVLEPKRGLLENIVILDYKSLYPTITISHNLCYTTVVTNDKEIIGIPKREIIKPPSGGKFVSANIFRGIVPKILEDLLNRRMETKKKMKTATEEEYRILDAIQLALKILLNSIYGYSGYARARLYSLTLANAITSFGRENLLNTQKLIEQEIKNIDGFDLEVVAGDTDSVFIKLSNQNGVSLDKAEKIGKSISEIVTKKLPKPMELEFEAIAKRAIFIAKKRYALWKYEKKNDDWIDKIEVKGMETIRRDWCELTSKTLNKVLEIVLKEGSVENAIKHVQEVVNSIRNIEVQKDKDNIIEDLIITRKYTKKADSYKNKQPHITVVEKLKKRGAPLPSIGDRVPYVIIEGNNLLVERAEDPTYVKENKIPLDVDYYIKKQILPPVERILKEFGVDFEVLNYDESQKSIFEFKGSKDNKKEFERKNSKPKKTKKRQKSLFDY